MYAQEAIKPNPLHRNDTYGTGYEGYAKMHLCGCIVNW